MRGTRWLRGRARESVWKRQAAREEDDKKELEETDKEKETVTPSEIGLQGGV